jgi:poly [ADP-ribose] polymerase 10/14/15
MFICRVLVGEYCMGYNQRMQPDERIPSANVLFDSTVNNTGSPSMYITYHDAQAYPEYFIEYS